MTYKSSTMRLTIGLALAVTIFVARDGNAVSFRANEARETDYGLQTALPKTFGVGEFTLDVRVRLDESYPVGRTGPQDSPGQLRNWSSADPAPYSRDDWWFEGNFLLDGHNNNAFWEGTFSIQFCGGGRVRWLFGDDVKAGPGGHWAVQAHPSSATPSLLDDQWHWISLVRRWAQNDAGADLELWVDGKKIATQHTNVRTNMRGHWDGFEGYPELQAGWFWGAEKQAAVGRLEQYEDFKGELSDVRFWDVARLTEELAAPEREIAEDAAGLVGLYRFPETFGGSVCNTLTGGECVEMIVSDRRWRPGGGLALQDWAAFAGFGLAAAAAFALGRKQGWNTSAGRVWVGIAVVMAVLALITWLDLESLVERSLRKTSKIQGWYDLRRAPQAAAILAIVAAAYYSFRTTTRGARGLNRATRMALGICALLIVIAVARTSSWTYTDMILNYGNAHVSVGRILELAGAIAIVAGAAFSYAAPGPK